MKYRYLLIAVIATMAFGSCTTSSKMVQSSPVIARNVELDPIKADIEVNQERKLIGEGVAVYVLGFRVSDIGEQKEVDGITYYNDKFRPLNRGRNKARAMAAYNALETCPDCDVLVHPKFEVIESKSPFGIIYHKYTVRVSGYGAKYKNFRTEKELKLIGDDGKEYIVIEENN